MDRSSGKSSKKKKKSVTGLLHNEHNTKLLQAETSVIMGFGVFKISFETQISHKRGGEEEKKMGFDSQKN